MRRASSDSSESSESSESESSTELRIVNSNSDSSCICPTYSSSAKRSMDPIEDVENCLTQARTSMEWRKKDAHANGRKIGEQYCAMVLCYWLNSSFPKVQEAQRNGSRSMGRSEPTGLPEEATVAASNAVANSSETLPPPHKKRLIAGPGEGEGQETGGLSLATSRPCCWPTGCDAHMDNQRGQRRGSWANDEAHEAALSAEGKMRGAPWADDEAADYDECLPSRRGASWSDDEAAEYDECLPSRRGASWSDDEAAEYDECLPNLTNHSVMDDAFDESFDGPKIDVIGNSPFFYESWYAANRPGQAKGPIAEPENLERQRAAIVGQPGESTAADVARPGLLWLGYCTCERQREQILAQEAERQQILAQEVASGPMPATTRKESHMDAPLAQEVVRGPVPSTTRKESHMDAPVLNWKEGVHKRECKVAQEVARSPVPATSSELQPLARKLPLETPEESFGELAKPEESYSELAKLLSDEPELIEDPEDVKKRVDAWYQQREKAREESRAKEAAFNGTVSFEELVKLLE